MAGDRRRTSEPRRGAPARPRSVARDERGHLQLGYRRAVWAALGERDENGRRARTTLAIRTSEHVRPIWRAAWPEDRLPERLVELAREVLSHGVDAESASREADRAQNRLDALAIRSTEQIAAVAAGYAALAALFCALRDELFDPQNLDVGALDEDGQPEERDASFLAAFACAGGPPWDPASHAVDRRAFWHWWLGQAGPAAPKATN